MSYLDDLLIAVKKQYARRVAILIHGDLVRHGYLINNDKSEWGWTRKMKSLGTLVDLEAGVFICPADKKDKIVAHAKVELARCRNKRRGPVRELASLIGKIMALQLVMGDSVRVFTRNAYAYIANLTGVPPDSTKRVIKVAWDRHGVTPQIVGDELEWFIKAIPACKGQRIRQEAPTATVQAGSDAGTFGYGGGVDAGFGEISLSRARLPARMVGTSSTLREAFASLQVLVQQEKYILEALNILEKELRLTDPKAVFQRTVLILMDSQSATTAMQIGSQNPDIQKQVRKVRLLLASWSARGIFRWVSRDNPIISLHDDQSKLDDPSDYMLDPAEFQKLVTQWGAYTIDRFASDTNKQLTPFNALVACPGSNGPGCGIDAFTRQWRWKEECQLHNNWIHPPYSQVGEAIRHLQREAARGTILVPLDTSAYWWPMVARGSPGVLQRKIIRRRPYLLWKFGTEPMRTPPRRDLIAVRMDFTRWGVSPSIL